VSSSLFTINEQQAQVESQEWRVIVSKAAGPPDAVAVFSNFGSAVTVMYSALQRGLLVRLEGSIVPLPEAGLFPAQAATP